MTLKQFQDLAGCWTFCFIKDGLQLNRIAAHELCFACAITQKVEVAIHIVASSRLACISCPSLQLAGICR